MKKIFFAIVFFVTVVSCAPSRFGCPKDKVKLNGNPGGKCKASTELVDTTNAVPTNGMATY
jgi:hypothetical protein